MKVFHKIPVFFEGWLPLVLAVQLLALTIRLLKYAIPPPPAPCHINSGSFLLLLCFSKHGQLDLFRASDSISDHLTLLFRENF